MDNFRQDFFDKNIKYLAGQRLKIYLYDFIFVLNMFALPVHFIKKKMGILSDRNVNLGCGATYLKGWFNVDGNPLRKKDLWLDLRRKWPFPNNSINGLIGAHLIEHFFDDELEHFFLEARRILKPGAFIRLEVPSLELLVKKYNKDGDAEYLNEKAFWQGAHRQIFDYGRLKSLLLEHDFRDITHYVGEKRSGYAKYFNKEYRTRGKE